MEDLLIQLRYLKQYKVHDMKEVNGMSLEYVEDHYKVKLIGQKKGSFARLYISIFTMKYLFYTILYPVENLIIMIKRRQPV